MCLHIICLQLARDSEKQSSYFCTSAVLACRVLCLTDDAVQLLRSLGVQRAYPLIAFLGAWATVAGCVRFRFEGHEEGWGPKYGATLPDARPYAQLLREVCPILKKASVHPTLRLVHHIECRCSDSEMQSSCIPSSI